MKELILFFALLPTIITAQNINNVTSQQNGNKINIKYNLEGLAPDDMVSVNLYYSLNKADYIGPLTEVEGDIGEYISENGTKTITWDVLSEIGSLNGDTKFKVEVIPSTKKEKPSASSKNIDGYVDRCQIDGTTLIIDYILESKTNESWRFYVGSTAIFDENGQKFTPDTFKWGNKTDNDEYIELIQGVPFRIQFVFANIDPSIKKLNGALIGDRLDKFKLRFSEIPVLKIQ